MTPKCRHIMPSGAQCRAYALRGEPFCFFHSRLHQAAKQPVSLIDSFEIPLLEDRCAVQLTITRVLRALVSKTIDRHSASTLLYGLQLALQSVDRSSWAIGFDTVEGLSQTSDGDVIAFDPDEDLDDDDEDEEAEEEEEEQEEEEEEEDDEDEEEEPEDEEEEEEPEEEEETPSDAASNSHHQDGEADDLENESTEQLIANHNQLQSVSRVLEAGDLRHAARLLRLGG
jgi:hypothetical protein